MKASSTIPYGKQWIDEKDIKEVVKTLRSGWITQGPKIDEFEKAVASYCKAKYAVAFSSGTAALHAAYFVAGIREGDEVITTPITFSATANAAVYCGGKPIFADIKKDTLIINPKEIEKKITKKTKVIAPVDFTGHPCDYDEIKNIAKKHDILIIEDAAQALGSQYKGKMVGSFSDMTIFSFHPVKVITTGEGGMVATNTKRFYEELKVFRTHGIRKKPEKGGWYYDIEEPGFNYRITDFQCALGISQLKKIDMFIKKRRNIVAAYNKAFKTLEEIVTPAEKEGAKSSWHIYVIQLAKTLRYKRKEIFETLQKEGIGVQVHHMPVHLLPFYKKAFGYKKGDYPVAEEYYQMAITLPLFPKMTQEEVKKVISVVNEVIHKTR